VLDHSCRCFCSAPHTQGDENSLERVMNFRIARTHKNGPTRQNTIWKQGKTNFQSVLDAYRLVFSTFQTQGSENSLERAMNWRIASTHTNGQTQQKTVWKQDEQIFKAYWMPTDLFSKRSRHRVARIHLYVL
jgi:hypothetical protein